MLVQLHLANSKTTKNFRWGPDTLQIQIILMDALGHQSSGMYVNWMRW